LSRDWELLKEFSRSEVRGQGHSRVNFKIAVNLQFVVVIILFIIKSERHDNIVV